MIKPKKGEVWLDQVDVLHTSPKIISKKMGVVGQFNELSFDFSVREMVLMGRTPHKKLMERDHAEDYRIVDEALEK